MDFSSPARRGTAPVRTLVAQAAALALLLGSAAAQAAPTVYLSDDTTLDYSLTLSYAASVRTSAAAAEYLADLNNDDATRNFKRGSLINNRWICKSITLTPSRHDRLRSVLGDPTPQKPSENHLIFRYKIG